MPRGRATSSSKDIYPQLLLIPSTEQSGADAYSRNLSPVPTPRFGGSATRPYVFEIVRIFWKFCPTVTAIAGNEYWIQLSTVPLTDIVEQEPRVFFFQHLIIDTTAGAVFTAGDLTGVWDYTDSQGHGLLVGTDFIYLGFDTEATAVATSSAEVRIEYRIKTVSATEYIGIVQSQQ